MKAAHFSSHHIGLISLEYLVGKGLLACVVIPDREDDFTCSMRLYCELKSIPLLAVSEYALDSTLKEWLVEQGADTIVVSTFPYRLPPVVLNVPKYGAWNLHHAPLPEFRGRETTFWQLAGQQEEGGMTLHRMDEGFDTGAILFQAKTPISREDTYGTHLNRAAQLAPQALDCLVSSIDSGDFDLQEQDEVLAKTHYQADNDDLTIDWEKQSAEEIAALCRAANPSYGGAITYFRGIDVRLLEVEAVELPSAPEAKCGSIAEAPGDPYLYVLCRDSWCLRVHVLTVPDGVFSGPRFRRVFDVKGGELFANREMG